MRSALWWDVFVLGWGTLDIGVVVPVGRALSGLRVVGTGQAGGGPAVTQQYWEFVDIAASDDTVDEPAWVIRTRARRGVRPTGTVHIDALTVDADVRSAARDAVTGLLSRAIPSGLGREEVRRRGERVHEQASQLQAAFTWLGPFTGPWQRAVVDVDGQDFAVWVHERNEGWAAALDLGPCLVSMHGTRHYPGWSLTVLQPGRAVAALTT